jgi:3-deoxy-D-manno-octulosonic-acid transferase
MLRSVCAIAAQTEADAARFRVLGAPAERVHVVGSLKFARESPASEASRCPVRLGTRPVLVAASTHEGEEEVVLEAARVLWKEQPGALLVVAPRHSDRFDRVARLLERLGLPYVRRTDGLEAVPEDVPVLLLDSVGELPAFFPASAAAFVGGTLVSVGGHNVLEPALSGAMVAFGPHVDKVRDAAALLVRAGVGAAVETAEELAAAWRDALRDPRPAAERARAVRELLGVPGDLARRTLAVVERCIRLHG